MNARTSRLLRRLAFVVARTEREMEAMQAAQNPGKARPNIPTEAMQLAHLKLAWNRTPRPQRGAQRVRCVEIFQTIVAGPAQ